MRGGGTLRRVRQANVIGRPRPTPANQETRCSPHPKNVPHPPQSPLRDPGKRLKWRWPPLRSRGVRTVKNLNPITTAVSLEAVITINRCRADCRSGQSRSRDWGGNRLLRRKGIITPGGTESLKDIFSRLCRSGFPKVIVLKSRCFLEH